MRKRAKKKSWLTRILLWTGVLLMIGLLGSALYAYVWMQSFIKSDAFRVMLAAQLSRATGSTASLEALNWSGNSLFVPKATLLPEHGQAWKQIEADGVQSGLDFSGIRRGVWSIPNISMDWLRMEMRDPQTPPAATEPTSDPTSLIKPHAPSWFSAWIPKRTEIGNVEVQSFEFTPAKDTSGVRVTGLKLNAKPASDNGAWLLRGTDGKLILTGVEEPFRITSTSARLDAKLMALNDLSARWIGDSEVTARGDLPFDHAKSWSFSGHYSNLDLRHLLGTGWRERIAGVLEGDYEASSQAPAPLLLKSKVAVKSGIVQNFPVLDRIADFTRTERFRRVVLDTATGDVQRQGETTKITNLLLQSNGLMRIEGELTLDGLNVNGTLFVGVLPETLRWIPGAQGQVFTETRSSAPSFVWTTVHLTGTMDDPREDLSNRLLAAAGKALIDAPLGIVTKGVEILSGSSIPTKGGTEASKEIIKTGTDVLQKGVEAGAGLLQGLLPK